MHGGMASAPSSLLAPAAASAAPPACPSTSRRPCHRRRSLSCRAAGGSRGDDRLLWLPRRDVLAGLTGVATGLASYPDLAGAAAPQAEYENCRRGDKISDKLLQCTDNGKPCPPSASRKIPDFVPEGVVKRVRQPVHLLDETYQEKYKEAVAKMKELDESNPLSFTAQAAIHEAYCDGHYRYDPTEKNRAFDVHFSWIFAPWHRMYIYFYERALGQLISDDTFALPYWNWDDAAGMALPAIFKDAKSSLYDINRHRAHLDALVDLDYIESRGTYKPIPFDPPTAAYDNAVNRNLSTIYQQMIRGGKGARCFLGDKLCTDTTRRIDDINERSNLRRTAATKLRKANNSGTLERMAHSAIHVWTGRSKDDKLGSCAKGRDGRDKCSNDMGFLGAAGRDPVFYSHHANVDRMWHLWNTDTDLGENKNFDDAEWLETSFVFYDNPLDPRPVRIKVRDVLSTANLGYTYDDDDPELKRELVWKNSKPTPLVPHGGGGGSTSKAAAPVFPVTLKPGQVVLVPAVPRPRREEGKLQVLVIDGIEFDPTEATKFDVAINLPEDIAFDVGPQASEYAGSFAAVASSSSKEKEDNKSSKDNEMLAGKVTLVIDDVLDDISVTGDTIDVVLVPRSEKVIKINVAPRVQNEAYC